MFDIFEQPDGPVVMSDLSPSERSSPEDIFLNHESCLTSFINRPCTYHSRSGRINEKAQHGMRCTASPAVVTASSSSRLADAAVNAAKRRQAAGLFDRCRAEGTEVIYFSSLLFSHISPTASAPRSVIPSPTTKPPKQNVRRAHATCPPFPPTPSPAVLNPRRPRLGG